MAEKQPKIYQQFDLDLEAMAKLSREERLNVSECAMPAILEGLAARGYDVLLGSSFAFGAPQSVIVAGDFRMPIKDDFSQIVARLRLTYKSGDFYMHGIPQVAEKR